MSVSLNFASSESNENLTANAVRIVGILTGASVEYVIAILAVLQCGFAFLPLEPSWPAERIVRIMSDSKPLMVLASQKTYDFFRADAFHSFPVPVMIIDLDSLVELDPSTGTSVAHCRCFCHSAGARPYCYVLYTSGSSGKPKGVYGTEIGLWHRLQWMQNEYPFLKDDIAIFKSSVGFIDHLTEVLGPILGGSLVIVPPFEELYRNPLGLLTFCQTYKVTRLTAVPSLMRAVLPSLLSYTDYHALMSINVLVLSGEILSCDLLRSIQRVLTHAIILNLYGCTEVSGDCLYFNCRLLDDEWGFFSVPIGKPLPGCFIEILSEQLETDDEGELKVGGVLVALGYHDERTFNDDRFTTVTDPNAVHQCVRFFRTGDYVKRLNDGNLLFLGRKDRIVKVHGSRVSLDEVEITLESHPLVAQCALRFQKGVSLDDILIAYVVLNTPRNQDLREFPSIFKSSETDKISKVIDYNALILSLKDWLAIRLPSAMIPCCLEFVNAIPYTKSGKVDYEALSLLPRSVSSRTSAFVEAQVGSLTSYIKRAFELVLKCKDISIHDNFFTLGGTSVSAAHIAHYLAIDMHLLYMHPSVIELESVLRELQQERNGSFNFKVDEVSPGMRPSKRVKWDHDPSSSNKEQSTLSEGSTFMQSIEDQKWPYIHMEDLPKVLLRCNVSLPMSLSISQHKHFLCPPLMENACTISILWKTQLGACVDASPVLMCSQSTCCVFIGSHAYRFFCVDAYYGKVLWEEEVGGRVESTAAIASDFKHIVLGSYDGYVYILDSALGTIKWKFQTKAEVKCQPTVDWRGFIWIGSHDHHLYILNVIEQKCVWQYDCKSSIFGAVAHNSKQFLSFVATTSGTLMAFSTNCFPPQIIWRRTCEAAIFGSPMVDTASGYLICTLVNGKVLALMACGSTAWEYTSGGPIFAGATLSAALPTQVLICSRDGCLYSLHLFKGECLWKHFLGEAITSAAYVDECLDLVSEESVDGMVYHHYYRLVCVCGSSGQVHLLKAYAGSMIHSTGFEEDCAQEKALGRAEFVDGNHMTRPAENDGTHNQGTVSVMKYKDHIISERCQFLSVLKLPGDIFSSPIMLGGRIFVGCRDDNVYCLAISGLGSFSEKRHSSSDTVKVTD
ncbi:hypothetical protein KP509_26G011000 [Ceratopteris richardii]|nr:hypothetical protein KP509_26G011000 [Ceratopteris richardii]